MLYGEAEGLGFLTTSDEMESAGCLLVKQGQRYMGAVKDIREFMCFAAGGATGKCIK
jgi:hypothetical protein